LFLESAAAGALLFGVSRSVLVIARHIVGNGHWHALRRILHFGEFAPFSFAAAATGAILLAVLLGLVSNSEKFWLSRWTQSRVRRWGKNSIDDTILKLFISAQESGRPVLLTLKNRKAYVGVVWSTAEMWPQMEHVRILPLMSGYRDQEKLVLHLETVYVESIAELNRLSAKQAAKTLNIPAVPDVKAADLQTYIARSEIVTASLFNYDVWARDNQARLAGRMRDRLPRFPVRRSPKPPTGSRRATKDHAGEDAGH